MLDNMAANILQLVGAILTLTSGLQQINFDDLKNKVSLGFYNTFKEKIETRNYYYTYIGLCFITLGYICSTMGWNVENPRVYILILFFFLSYICFTFIYNFYRTKE